MAAGLSVILLCGCESTSRVASRTYHLLPFTKKTAPIQASEPGSVIVRTGKLALKMKVSPRPLKLSDVRQIDVRIQLENISKRFVQLEFPTSQRIDILIHDEAGKPIVQWSEDRAFDTGVSYVGINPGEHVEYSTTLSTRDLQPGKKYTVVGFFPNFADLKAEETIHPQP